MRYDPNIAPSASEWLALDESERIWLALRFHEDSASSMPNVRVHAVIHVVVETQIAMELPSVVGALARLQEQGLDRHDAIHAIGSVFADRVWRIVRGIEETGDPNPEYFAALDQLSAESWRREYG